jgi:hypothetical protein
MANSTARSIANIVLESLGQRPIGSDADYIDLSKLSKVQRQCVIFLDLMHRMLGVEFNKRFMWREFTIETTAVATEYTVNSVIVEGFKANSFFNVTNNGIYNGNIAVRSYEQWREAYPNPELTQRQHPLFLVPLPDDGTGNTKVMLWPYADAVYTIKGQSRLLISPITAGSQLISIPPHYEHVLIFKACEVLETRLNEGREQDFKPYIEEAIQTILRDSTGAYEEVEQIDLGVSLYSRGRRDQNRRFNPLTDVPPQI